MSTDPDSLRSGSTGSCNVSESMPRSAQPRRKASSIDMSSSMRRPLDSPETARASVNGFLVSLSSRTRPAGTSAGARCGRGRRCGLDLLLAVDHLGVRARAHVGERLVAVELDRARLGDVEPRLGVERRVLEVDSDPAEPVDQAREADEVDLHVAVHRDAQAAGDGRR